MLPKKQSYRVLLVGCGNLGIRHLQAVSGLPMVREIEVVDPRAEALVKGRRFIADMPVRQNAIRFRWNASIEDVSKGGDLCIVVTQAKGRCRVIRDVAEKLGYRSFLIEKIVSQSVSEYEDLLSFSKERNLSIWVNCKTRTYPIHQYVKERIGSNGPISFSVVGGNHGLANNGVHCVDLFTFYDESPELQEVGTHIDPVLHPSKRGEDLFDLSGVLQATTCKGSHFTLSFAANHVTSDYISINAAHYRCIIDHMHRWVVESDADTGWNWKTIPFEGNLMVSHMSKQFVTDILMKGKCELPTLKDCYPAHKYLLTILQKGFSRLMKREVISCPIA